MLVFAAEETYFHCPSGLLTESICLGDKPNQSLRLKSVSNIRLCGLLRRAQVGMGTGPPTITNRTLQYESVYLVLLRPYMGRVLTYDSDISKAYSGIIHAQSRILGDFHMAMPVALFGRALLLRARHMSGLWSRRAGFPSWSWLGWKHNSTSMGAIEDIRLQGRPLLILVHLYVRDEVGQPTLLLGPRDDAKGIEGYCSRSIACYNEFRNFELLPIHPSIIEWPLLPEDNIDPSQLLVFWTHVAAFSHLDFVVRDIFWQFDSPEDQTWRERYQSQPIEVVLIAVSTISGFTGNNLSNNQDLPPRSRLGFHKQCDRYYGIVIERHRGFARRIGLTDYMTRAQWLSGHPRKELILLI